MARLRNLEPVASQHYCEKSLHFFNAMQLLGEDVPAYATAVALLAVHTAIALNDAILLALSGKRSKAEMHMEAVTALKRVCGAQKISDKRGIQHLTWLLGNKTRIAYGAERLDEVFVRGTRDKAERFHAWAYNIFAEVLRVPADSN